MPKKVVEKKEEQIKAVQTTTEATPAQILEIIGSIGTREGGKQVRVKILAGKEAGKIMRRNVVGPFRVGDILMLKETEIEASTLKGRKG